MAKPRPKVGTIPYWPIFALVGIGAISAALVFVRPSSLEATRFVPHAFLPSANERTRLAEPAAIQTAIDRATEYLIANCRESGKFVYLRRVGDIDPEAASKYNVLRHSGAIYALCQRHAWHQDARIPWTVSRAVKFLRTKTFDIVAHRDDMLAVWSRSELNGGENDVEAKLGGTGLALVALLDADRIQPGLVPEDELEKLGRFLLFMQRADGSFYSKYIPAEGGRTDNWVSLYYPGEAALGLSRLYQRTGDPIWYEAALRTLVYLADTRDRLADVPADHWALLATADLMAIQDPSPIQPDVERLLRHTRQVCRSMLNQQQRDPNAPFVLGSFSFDGRTTPTATRLEGLTAALKILPESETDLRAEIRTACQLAVEFLVATQYSGGDCVGGLPRGAGRIEPTRGANIRTLNRRCDEIRIDYVQHAMSGWIQYLQLP